MLESKKALDCRIRFLAIYGVLAKPLMAKAREDKEVKEALNALETGREMIESAIEVADSIFRNREEAAAKRQGAKAPSTAPSSSGKGKPG